MVRTDLPVQPERSEAESRAPVQRERSEAEATVHPERL